MIQVTILNVTRVLEDPQYKHETWERLQRTLQDKEEAEAFRLRNRPEPVFVASRQDDRVWVKFPWDLLGNLHKSDAWEATKSVEFSQDDVRPV